jgi:nitrogen fixation protein NifQ
MDARAYLDLIDQPLVAAIGRVRGDEYEDLVGLLFEHAAHDDADTADLVDLVARACLGENHLWQDLGLPSRQFLSDLLRENFPLLFERNSGNMRWKKFFYLQLCERAEVRACRAPSCGVCVSRAECFGAEEGLPLAAVQPALRALHALAVVR